jgi:hypothetical protein
MESEQNIEKESTGQSGEMLRIGIAADHGGFELKVQLTNILKATGYEVVDFGAHKLVIGDDYPDFVVPLARAVARGIVTRDLGFSQDIFERSFQRGRKVQTPSCESDGTGNGKKSGITENGRHSQLKNDQT